MNSSAVEELTRQTMEAIRKAQTAGVTVGTGIFGYDLSDVVSLVPVNTPLYDRFSRKPGSQGSKAATWRSMTNVNNAQPNPFVGVDAGGNFVQFAEQDVMALYQPVRVSGRVTDDSIDFAEQYEDTKALGITGTLMQWRILDNKSIIGGQNFALAAIGTPAVVTATTGGNIGQTIAVNVKVAARSPYNFYWGGSGIASAQGTATTPTDGLATHSATATVVAVKGAVAYDWYVAGFYYTTTTTNTVLITSVPVANAPAVPNIPDLFVTAPTAVPVADTTGSANAYNGLIASTLGDYSVAGPIVTPGTGTGSGAIWTTLNGALLTGTSQGITEIDNLLLQIFNSVQLSPTALVMNAQQANDIANRVLGTNQATTYLNPNPSNNRVGLTAGGSVAHYVNRASGGDIIDIVVDPHFPVGTVMAISERVPFPNSGIANTFEVRTLRDVRAKEYGTSLTPGGALGGPRTEWDVSSNETFVNRAPVACGVLSNIGNG